MLTRRSKRLGQYLFYERNPIVLIIYLIVLTGSAVLFLWNTVHRLPASLLVPIPPLLALPYVFTYLCVTYKAHYIRPSNHRMRMRDYPYDRMLFRPNTVCRTCNLVKPARSKHCGLCGHCVAKCDHHCPWVDNCLGRGNYRHFLALLLALGLVQFYGAYLAWWLLSPHFRINPANAFFSRARLSDVGHAVVIAVNRGGLSIAGVGLLAASTSCLPLGLLAYHLYLIWAGMTTNESQKWTDWKDDMADGYAFIAKREDLRTHNELRTYGNHASGSNNPALGYGLEDEQDSGLAWPLHSDYVLVRTTDGKAPDGQEALWTRVWNLDDVDNIYDLGSLTNFLEVLHGR